MKSGWIKLVPDSVVYFALDLRTVPTVWYILLWISELWWQCGIFCFGSQNCADSVVYFALDLRTVLTVWYNLLWISELCWQCGIFYFGSQRTVGTVLRSKAKYTTLSAQFWDPKQNIPHCRHSSEIQRYIFLWISELCWQCGIFYFGSQNCADSVVYFTLDLRTVLTVWYILLWISVLCFGSQNCADSVVYFTFHFIADKNLVNFLMR
jgi:hypothetical protein